MSHPAADLPHERRVEYLQAVTALAFVDMKVDDAERGALTELGRALGLSDADAAQVKPPEPAALLAILERVRADEKLCVELLRDAIIVAFADGEVDASESHLLAEMARRLGLTLSDAGLIARSVREDLAAVLEHDLAEERGAVAQLFKRMTQRLKI